MAGGGLLAVLDDITTILDDVAAMSKLAVRKTAGIVGDDLAVNANVVVGLDPTRELPIVGKIALGSLANKAVLIPIALALPTPAITPLLMVGGAFLCYEAVHKLLPHGEHEEEAHHQEMLEAIQESPEALMKMENQKVWGAIGTDVVLSAEVIAVALGEVAQAPLMTKALALTVVGVGMTVGVYGMVACIVKADDLGLHLQKAAGGAPGLRQWIGRGLVKAMPWFMKLLSFLGTAAMFTVGGGILLHGFPAAEHALEALLQRAPFHAQLGGLLGILGTVVFGILAGVVTMPVFGLAGRALAALKPGRKGGA